MGLGEAAKAGLPVGGELDPGDAPVGGIGPAFHHAARCGTVHQFDHAVVTQKQAAGQARDSRPGTAVVTLDRAQQPVLAGRQADGPGLALAPAQEPPEAGAERQQVLEVALR